MICIRRGPASALEAVVAGAAGCAEADEAEGVPPTEEAGVAADGEEAVDMDRGMVMADAEDDSSSLGTALTALSMQ